MPSAAYSNQGTRARNPAGWVGGGKLIAKEREAAPTFPNHPGEDGEQRENDGAAQPAAGVEERVEAAKARFAEGVVETGGRGILPAVLLATMLDVAAGGAAAVSEVLPPEMQGAQHEGGEWGEAVKRWGLRLRLGAGDIKIFG